MPTKDDLPRVVISWLMTTTCGSHNNTKAPQALCLIKMKELDWCWYDKPCKQMRIWFDVVTTREQHG